MPTFRNEHNGDVGWIIERAVALAHVHRFELAGVLQPALHGLLDVRLHRRADADARQPEDLAVGHRRVAVDPDLADRLGGR